MTDILVVGDSFTDKTVHPWKKWPQILGERLKLVVDNRATAGGGYVSEGVHGPHNRRSFSQQLLVGCPPAPKLVVVFGSCNDRFADRVEVRTTALFTLRETMTQYPNAKHLWIGPQWSGTSAPPPEMLRLHDDILTSIWKLQFQYYMNPMADNWFPRDRPDLWEADQFHPNAAGQVMMADRIEPAARHLLGR